MAWKRFFQLHQPELTIQNNRFFFPDFGHIFLYLTPNLNGDDLNISVHQIDLGFGFVVPLNLETKVKMWANHQPIYLLGENVKIKPCLKQLFQVYFPVLPGLQIRYHHSHHSHHFPLHKITSQHQNLGFCNEVALDMDTFIAYLAALERNEGSQPTLEATFATGFCEKVLNTNGKTQKLSSWPANRLEMLKWRNQSLIYWFRILKKNLLQYTLIFPKGAFSAKTTSQKELE